MLLKSDRKIIQKLVQAKVPFFLSMGYAVNYYTGWRSFSDIDVVVTYDDLDLVAKLLPADLKRIKKRGIRIDIIKAGNIEVSTFSRFKESTVYFNPDNKRLYKRCQFVEGEDGIRVISREDLIIKKLFYGRKKDMIDIDKLIWQIQPGKRAHLRNLVLAFLQSPAKLTLLKNLIKGFKYVLPPKRGRGSPSKLTTF